MSSERKTFRQPTGISFEDCLKLLAAILAATVLAVNLSIVRPLKDRMEDLKRQVADMQSEVQLLTGERDQVRNTNDLLSGLKAQEAAFEGSRHVLSTLRQFREEVAAEGQKTGDARASLEQIAALQQALLRCGDAAPAEKALAKIINLQKQLIEQNVTVDDAIDAVNRLSALKRNLVAEAADAGTAESALNQLVSIKTQLAAQNDDLATASIRAKALVDLKSQLLQETNDLDAATSACDGLLAIKEKLVVRGGAITDAQQNADRLLGLRDRLAENGPKIDEAERGATRLFEMQKKLAGQTPNLAEAVKSIETLLDLQHEFQERLRSLDSMRRGLLEIVMMESTVAQAVRTLQPLLDLGNLRHLDQGELRRIARSISDERATRISASDTRHAPTRASTRLGPTQYNPNERLDDSNEPLNATRIETPVPWPTEAD